MVTPRSFTDPRQAFCKIYTGHKSRKCRKILRLLQLSRHFAAFKKNTGYWICTESRAGWKPH